MYYIFSVLFAISTLISSFIHHTVDFFNINKDDNLIVAAAILSSTRLPASKFKIRSFKVAEENIYTNDTGLQVSFNSFML